VDDGGSGITIALDEHVIMKRDKIFIQFAAEELHNDFRKAAILDEYKYKYQRHLPFRLSGFSCIVC
jgi:hypothetical protein